MTRSGKWVTIFFVVFLLCTALHAETCLLVDEGGTNCLLKEDGLLVRLLKMPESAEGEILQVMKRVVIADFDNPFNHDLYNDHTLGCWTINPSDITQGSRYAFDNQDAKSYGFGSCIKVRYDVESVGRSRNGFWIKPQKIQLSDCDFLSFWVKGSDRFGYTTSLVVGIKSDLGGRFEYEVGGINAQWQNYLISFKDFKHTTQGTMINEIFITFNSEGVTKNKGVLFFDQFEYLTVSKL